MSVLKYAAVGILLFVHLAVTYVLSQENLPFLTCCVLISCYLWNSYRPFTKKISGSCFETLWTVQSAHGQCMRHRFEHARLHIWLWPYCWQCEENSERTFRHGLRRTNAHYKEYFPNGFESHFKRDLRSGCFLVYDAAKRFSCNKKIAHIWIVAARSLPKIITIYVERRRKRNLKAVPIDDKARKVAFEYINISSPCNQREKLLCVYPMKDALKGGDRLDPLAFALSPSPLISVSGDFL